MLFLVEDYSHRYFLKRAEKQMPNLRTGKFVQIYGTTPGSTDLTEHLLFAPAELCTYHANIVALFCTLRGIEGGYRKGRDYYVITSRSWAIAGGGQWMQNDTERLLKLWGTSKAYGDFDARGLGEKLCTIERLKDYTITINP